MILRTILLTILLTPGLSFAQGRISNLQVGNINLAGSTVSTTNTNGDLTFTMNGSGSMILSNLNANTVLTLDASKKVKSSAVTPTELSMLSGLTGTFLTNINTATVINKTMSGSSNTFTNLPLTTAVTGVLPVVNGGTGQSAGTSGGILGYVGTGTLSTSSALTASQLILGGGAGGLPSTLAAGSQYQVLVMGASNPGYGQVNLAQSAAVTGVLPNANTTAASANTASAIVTRDGSGNFSAGTVSAALTGTASGNTTYTANQYGVVASGSGNAMTVIAPAASTTKVLASGGASANPIWTESNLLSNINASNIQSRSVSSTAPSDTNLLIYNSTTATWVPGSLSGDVTTSNLGAATVAKIQNKSVSSSTPSDAAHLIYNSTTSTWVPVVLSGDVTATNLGAATVAKIQNKSVSASAPGDTNLLIYNSTTATWVPGSLSGDVTATNLGAATVAKIQGKSVSASAPSDTNLLIYNSTTSTWVPGSLSGDGTITNLGVLTVAKIQNKSVTSATPSDAGLLIYNSTTSSWVPGVLSSDVTISNLGVATVAKLQSVAVASTSPTNTQVLVFNSTGSQWRPVTVSGDTTILNTGAVTVAKLQGVAVATTSPTNTQVLVFNSTGSQWTPVSFAGDVTVTNTGATTVAKIQSVAVSTTSPTSGQILTFNSTVSNWTPGNSLSNPMDGTGQLIYGGASGAATKLAAGTTAQVLIGSATAPSWGTGPGQSIVTATSVTKTAGANNNWHQHTTNSLVLGAGRYLLFGSAAFGFNSAGPSYTDVATMWSSANGNDTSSTPAALSLTTNLTVLSVFRAASQTWLQGTTVATDQYVNFVNVAVSCASSCTVYGDTFATFSGTASNTRVTVYLNALLLSPTP